MRVPCRLICASVVREVVPSVARQAGLSLTILESKIVPRRLKTFFCICYRYEMQKQRIAAHPSMLVSALLFDAPIGLV